MSPTRPGRPADPGQTLTCTITHQPPVTVIHVRGGLSLATAPNLGAAVAKALSHDPTAVICHVADLRVIDDLAVTAFAAAARRAAAWPGIPLVVCAAPQPLAEALSRLGIDWQLTIATDLAQARRSSRQRRPSPQLRRRLQPVVDSVPAARRMIVDTCAHWNLPHLTDPAGLVLTELVTNAVRHAGTPIDLTITRGRHLLHLAVRDYTTATPSRTGPPAEHGPGGRGLLIVEALATHWGYTPTTNGKVTWADFQTTRPPANWSER